MLGTLSWGAGLCLTSADEQGLNLCKPCRSLQELHLQGRMCMPEVDALASHQQLRRPERSAPLRVLSLTEGMQVRRDPLRKELSWVCGRSWKGRSHVPACHAGVHAEPDDVRLLIGPQLGIWFMESCVQLQGSREKGRV